MSAKDSVEIAVAAKISGSQSAFGDGASGFGSSGRWPSNFDRDLLRDARSQLGVNFQLYNVRTIIKDREKVSKSAEISVLFPYEVAHWLYELNRDKFFVLFSKDRIHDYWCRMLQAGEAWFVAHPLYEDIRAAVDKSLFLPLHLFGDDGTLRKTRVFRTITWYSALFSKLSALHSRIPFYIIGKHAVLADFTEIELQKVLCWSFEIWSTGRFPHLDHRGEEWPRHSWRRRVAGSKIAGGHVGCYTGTVGDLEWIALTYRYEQRWNSIEICPRCFCRDAAGPLNYCGIGPFPERDHEDYMASDRARASPLSAMPGYHLTITRGEAMHVGPLGVLPDAVGSSLLELCDMGAWGFVGQTPWQDRLTSQLAGAFQEFHSWSRVEHEEHTLKSFSCKRFDMHTLQSSWPRFKGKAHDCLVLARWQEQKCARFRSHSSYAELRHSVLWAWVEWFEVALKSTNPDFLSTSELKRLDIATRLLILGSNSLAVANFDRSLPRWKLRPKLHCMLHLNDDCQRSKRSPRAFWSFKEEESMGKLSLLSGKTHSLSMHARSLDRWCVQFFTASTND